MAWFGREIIGWVGNGKKKMVWNSIYKVVVCW